MRFISLLAQNPTCQQITESVKSKFKDVKIPDGDLLVVKKEAEKFAPTGGGWLPLMSNGSEIKEREIFGKTAR